MDNMFRIPESQTNRRLHALIVLLLVTPCALTTAILCLGGRLFVPDDVYFYLQIARNVVDGKGSTFNGLVPTNGYHPLWMAVTVVEAWITGSNSQLLIVAHHLVSGAGTLAAGCLFVRLLLLLGYLPIASSLGGLLTVTYGLFNHSGSEFHISLPLLIACTIVSEHASRGGLKARRRWFGFGVLLGVTLLARLDNVFVLVALIAFSCRGKWLAARWRASVDVAVLAGGVLLVLGPYLISNWLKFHHVAPISAAVKSGLARATWMGWRFGTQGTMLTIGAALACVAPAGTRNRRLLMWLGVGALVHAVYTALNSRAIWSWYFAGELLVCSTLIAHAADIWLRSRTNASRLTIGLALGLLGCIPPVSRGLILHSHPEKPWYVDVSLWVNANLPAGAVVVAACSPGSIAFFSNHPVFALDGLTGDFAFHTDAAKYGLAHVLAARHWRFLYSMGPESKDLTQAIGRTTRYGEAGEAVSFYGLRGQDGSLRLSAVGLFSPIAMRDVGRINLRQIDLVHAFPKIGMSIWRIED